MDVIREWLNSSRNYNAGATLYLKHGKDEKLKRIFREPASDFKKQKLAEALRSLLNNQEHAAAKQEEQKATTIQRERLAEKRWPKERDTTLEALHQQWRIKFLEMTSLQSRIYDVALAGQTDSAKKQEAGQMAHRILDLDDECDDLYRQRDHYIKHNRLPEEPKPMDLVVDVKKIPLALANCQRYIRDYKNKLLKEPGNVKAAAQLQKYQWAAAEYQKTLNLN